MARTLSQLKESIENLIQNQGPDAPVAAFIFTNEDVCEFDDECNPQYLPIETAEKVLDAVESDYDHLYSEIFDCIEEQIQEVKKNA